MNTETRILEPGQIEIPAGQIRSLLLAGRDRFKLRAERFRLLADGHSLGGYLGFLALLADAQQNALNHLPAPVLPDAEEQELCRKHGMPLLSARSRPRDPAWQAGLAVILHQMGAAGLPPAAREAVASLKHMAAAGSEQLADRILAGEWDTVAPQELPFVAAALQVYWLQMATVLGEGAFGQLEQGGLCPVCGMHPVAGLVRTGGAEQGLRYLCCSLCATQWHMVRVKCSSCESTRSISLYTLEGGSGAVRAEGCDDCGTYLKLLYLEKDNLMEAMADDLATLALDMLMEQEGKSRGGPNLFFHPGKG